VVSVVRGRDDDASTWAEASRISKTLAKARAKSTRRPIPANAPVFANNTNNNAFNSVRVRVVHGGVATIHMRIVPRRGIGPGGCGDRVIPTNLPWVHQRMGCGCGVRFRQLQTCRSTRCGQQWATTRLPHCKKDRKAFASKPDMRPRSRYAVPKAD
jgi:hypothetical protein